jgi:hypothetical protein
MTIKVLEHNGVYTAYRRIVKRSDDGQLYESIKRIDLPFPPTDLSLWPVWAVSLTHDELDVGLQLFFDKWNFGNGTNGEGKVYQHLCDERERRKQEDKNLGPIGPMPSAVSAKAALQNMKNELNQKRIPSQSPSIGTVYKPK